MSSPNPDIVVPPIIQPSFVEESPQILLMRGGLTKDQVDARVKVIGDQRFANLDIVRAPFHHRQETLATTWVITHGLNRYPAAVSIILLTGEVVEADVTHVSENQTVVDFPSPMNGRVEIF